MKRIVFLIALIAISANSIRAQEPKAPKFDPQAFRQHMERALTQEACLTTEEANAVFPIYNEMREKQRAIYDKMRKLGMNKPSGDEACKQAILEYDKLNLELRQLDVVYHKKMLKVIPASFLNFML